MDSAGCRAALHTHVPGIEARQVRVLGEGWDSTAFLVDDRLVVRFPRRPAVAETLLREARLLPELAPWLPCPAPQFLFLIDAGGEHGLPFAGYPLVPGIPLEHTALRPAARERLATECGRFLAALHSFPAERARRLELESPHPCTGAAGWAAFRSRAETAAGPHLTLAGRAALAAWFERAEDEGISRFTPALVHADLGNEHLLVEPDTGALTGVIDWADATIGDPAIDFAGLLNALGPAAAEHALTAYGPGDRDMLRRAQIYAEASSLHEVIFAAETGDGSHLGSGLARLHSVLEKR